MSHPVCATCLKTIFSHPRTSERWAGEFCSEECEKRLDAVCHAYEAPEEDDEFAMFDDEEPFVATPEDVQSALDKLA